MNHEKLLINLSNEIKLRNYSRQTHKSYLYNVSKFLQWIKINELRISSTNIKKYLLEFSKNRDSNTIKLGKASIKFFLLNVLKKEKVDIDIPKMKKKKQLPKVISKEEIKILLENIKNKKHKLMISLLYSSGIRLSELIFLKREHLNLNENTILVKQGKGKKDRITIISNNIKKELVDYISQTSFTTKYIFESNRYTHYTCRTIQQILTNASKKIKSNKNITPHMLRHSFATHLLNSGVDIRIIQKLLGHQNLETTSIYTYISNKDYKNIKNPLDNL